MSRYRAASVLLFMMPLPLLRADDGCSQERLNQASANAKAAQAQLMAIKVGRDDMPPEISPSTKGQIHSMKDALTSVADGFLNCKQKNLDDANSIRADLSTRIGANQNSPQVETRYDKIPEVRDSVYGANLELSVWRKEGQLQILGLQFSFGIPCNFDTLLLLYEWKDSRWTRVLRWQSGDYSEISAAFGDFFNYSVISQESAKDWFVAVAHGHPWCTSRWSGFDIDLIQPARGTSPQKVLLRESKGYVREESPTFKSRADGFELRTETGCLDIAIMTRPVIYRYRLVGNELRRVQPVAPNGRIFVDEWLQSPWNEAAGWTATDQSSALRLLHSKFMRLRDPKAERPPEFSYGSVRACSDNPNRFQVELNLEPGGTTFFFIRQGQNSFTMLSASDKADSRCNGPDLMKKP